MYHGQLAMLYLDKANQNIVFTELKAVIKECAGGYSSTTITHKFWAFLAKYNLKLCCKIRNKLGVGL